MAGPCSAAHFVSRRFEWAAMVARISTYKSTRSLCLEVCRRVKVAAVIARFSADLAQAYSCYTATQGLSVRACNLKRAQNEIKSCCKE